MPSYWASSEATAGTRKPAAPGIRKECKRKGTKMRPARVLTVGPDVVGRSLLLALRARPRILGSHEVEHCFGGIPAVESERQGVEVRRVDVLRRDGALEKTRRIVLLDVGQCV